MRDKFLLPYSVDRDKNIPQPEFRDPEFDESRKAKVVKLSKVYGLDSCNFRAACAKLPKDGLFNVEALSDFFGFHNNKTFSNKEFADEYLKRRNVISDELRVLKHEQHSLKSSGQHAQLQQRRGDSHKDGRLIVQISSVQAKINDNEAFKKLRIHLDCKNQTIETQSARFIDGTVDFNELFSFKIPEPTMGVTTATLELSFKEESSPVTRSSAIVQVSNLKDQMVQMMTVNLTGDLEATAKIAVQWVYDPSALYAEYAKQYSKRQETIAPSITEKQRLLKFYDTPFNNSYQGYGHMVKGVVRGDLAADKFDEWMENYGLTSTQKASQVFVSAYLIIACFASYARALFMDQGIALFAFFFNLEQRRWSGKKYRNCMMGLGIAAALDVWWISSYLLKWGGHAAEVPFVHITRIFTVILFIWRIILGLFFWKCSRDLKTRTSNGIRTNRFPNSPSEKPIHGLAETL